MKKLIPLCVYSYFDFLNSTISPKKYLKFLKENFINEAPLLSSNYVFGNYKFIKFSIKNNLKPIIGLTVSKVLVSFREIEVSFFPKNYEGYKKMNLISSLVVSKEEKTLKIEDLKLISKDLIFVISFNNKINQNNFEDIKKSFSFVSELYWGLTLKTEYSFYKKFLKTEKLINFKSVRFLKDSEEKLYNIVNSIKIDTFKNTKNFSFFRTFDDYSNEVKEILIKNQNELISKINLKIPIKKELRFNNILGFNEIKSFEKLKNICEIELNKKFLNLLIYKTRLEKELKIIRDKKFSNYFLIVKEYVDFAINKNILVGPGRGSAPGSLICFLLDITKIDPIKYNLLFERFLNYERKELPDIDIDFEDKKRNEVITHIIKKYGNFKVGLISTFQRIAAKTAIRDIGRIMKIDIQEINEISKEIPSINNVDLKKAIQKSMKLRNYKIKYPKLFEYAFKIIGFPRQKGIHAAGLVISDIDFRELTGIWVDNSISVIQMDMKYIEEFGLVKMDILGLRNLSLISNILEKLSEKINKNLYLLNINLEDEETYKLLSNGLTDGIFQLESRGMTKLIKKIKPKKLEDIVITISLFRPGSLKYKDVFIERREKNSEFVSIIPEFYSILKSTEGIPIFQEQIIQMVQVFSGLSPEKADILRRAISKKNIELFNVFKKLFFSVSKSKKYKNELIEKVWEMIVQFVGYGFNRSHAVGYSIIAYWTAYLKTKEYSLFLKELLNTVIGDISKTSEYLKLIKGQKIKINNPTVNKNIFLYQITKTDIFLPISLIKSIGSVFLNKLNNNLKINGKFKNLFDFFLRMKSNKLSKKIYKNLVFSGSLDCFGYSRKTLIKNLERINIYYKAGKINEKKIIWDIIEEPELILYEEKIEEELIIDKKTALGFDI